MEAYCKHILEEYQQLCGFSKVIIILVHAFVCHLVKYTVDQVDITTSLNPDSMLWYKQAHPRLPTPARCDDAARTEDSDPHRIYCPDNFMQSACIFLNSSTRHWHRAPTQVRASFFKFHADFCMARISYRAEEWRVIECMGAVLVDMPICLLRLNPSPQWACHPSCPGSECPACS